MENSAQIPIPDRSETAHQKYHFYKLNIGDHMDIEYNEPKEAAKIRVAASNYGIRNNKTMVTRTYKEEVPFILRIWRQS
tara:strand:- start:13221 stop:13457 length:237 start_codon:yes stop_codon:yes gene_type:complete